MAEWDDTIGQLQQIDDKKGVKPEERVSSRQELGWNHDC